MYNLQLSRKLLWLEPYCSTPEVHQTSSKAGSGINILYLLTGPIALPPVLTRSVLGGDSDIKLLNQLIIYLLMINLNGDNWHMSRWAPGDFVVVKAYLDLATLFLVGISWCTFRISCSRCLNVFIVEKCVLTFYSVNDNSERFKRLVHLCLLWDGAVFVCAAKRVLTFLSSLLT